MLARDRRVQFSVAAEIGLHRNLLVLLNDEIRVAYDIMDGSNIDTRQLEQVDWYFKRSFHSTTIRALGAIGNRVKPLGLNYLIYPDFFDLAGARRNWCMRRGFRRATSILRPLLLRPRYTPHRKDLEAPPAENISPCVLFLTRAWDPQPVHHAGSRIMQDRREQDRREINETRATCITLLRKTFGKQVFAGFSPSEFVTTNYRHLVINDERVTRQRNYLRTMKTFPICVTTTGLWGSIGWKTAEYVACSRSIVSEPLKCVLPGGFEHCRNYLEFTTPESCAEQVERLMSDRDLRLAIMRNNFKYYQEYLRPDRLVLNTFKIATELSSRRPVRTSGAK